MQELLTLDVAKPEAMGSTDHQVEDGPAQAEAARLAREAAHDLGASADFLERTLQQIGAAQPAAQAQRIA